MFNPFKLIFVLNCLFFGMVGSSFAQSVRLSSESYQEKQVLPFEPASPKKGVVIPAIPSIAIQPAQPNPPNTPLLNQSPTTFSVARSDRTLREALSKWARSSGWTFEPEHWSVPRDIPVAGGASVDTDFKTAVRMLLRSTELTDLPVQPCFYNANQTLRVVPIADSCTRGN